MNSSQVSTDASARSPFAGCLILITALLVMVFLIGFSIASLFRQFNEIAKFTSENPDPTARVSLESRLAERHELDMRLQSFSRQLDGTGPAELALTPAEINLAIEAYEPFKDLRGHFAVMAVTGDSLRIAISFPLNGKPRLSRKGEDAWFTADPRYLNGTLVARPALLKHELILLIDSIEVPGTQVPREFIEQMSPYRLTERYLTDPLLGPAMARLTRVGVVDGKLLLAHVPGETAPDAIGKQQVDAASQRFFIVLGLVACAILALAGFIVWHALRSKAPPR